MARKQKTKKNLAGEMRHEGGAHQHSIDPMVESLTRVDGEHQHLFILNGHALLTEKDGAHAHMRVDKAIGAEQGEHMHGIYIGEDLMETEPATSHDHAPLEKGEGAWDGQHVHKLTLLDGSVVESILPEDLMDRELRKRLRIDIQTLVFSKDRFLTFERAAAWLDEHGMNPDNFTEHEKEFLFMQRPASAFEETSLKTIDMFDGVRAIVGITDDDEEEEEEDDEEGMQEEATFDSLQELLVAESPILSEPQAEQLAALRQDIAAQVAEMLATANKAIPLLSQFIESVLDSSVGDQAVMALADRVAADMLAAQSVLRKIKLPASNIEDQGLAELVAKAAGLAAQLDETFTDTSFERLHLLFKSCAHTFARAREEIWKQAAPAPKPEEAQPKPAKQVEKVLVPTKEMSRADRQLALKARHETFGIEITEDASLTFPAGFPVELEKFGDPVNLKFPMETQEQVKQAITRFKKFSAEIYKQESSRDIVQARLTKRQEELFPVIAVEAQPPAGGTVEKNFFVQLQKAAGEQRVVFGIVLEPDVTDLHGDTYDEEAVKEAAWTFMEDFANPGLMHEELIDGRVRILESFIAPINMALPVDGGSFNVRKGTWLMTWRIKDDELWGQVKTGELTGFSIGARAAVENLRN